MEVGVGCLAKGGSGGDGPPLKDDLDDLLATIDLLRSGVRLLALIVVSYFKDGVVMLIIVVGCCCCRSSLFVRNEGYAIIKYILNLSPASGGLLALLLFTVQEKQTFIIFYKNNEQQRALEQIIMLIFRIQTETKR